MRDLTKINQMDSDSLSVMLDEIEKERHTASSNLDMVTENKLDLERQIAEIKIIQLKGKQNLRSLSSEKEIVERAFWRSRNR